MTLDFLDRAFDKLKTLELGLPLYVGLLDREDSLALYPIAGGRTTQMFYDGTKEKLLNYEIGVKTKMQSVALSSLGNIAQYLENTSEIPSCNGSYDFQNIAIASESYYVGNDEQGFFFYRVTFQVKLTIKGD